MIGSIAVVKTSFFLLETIIACKVSWFCFPSLVLLGHECAAVPTSTPTPSVVVAVRISLLVCSLAVRHNICRKCRAYSHRALGLCSTRDVDMRDIFVDKFCLVCSYTSPLPVGRKRSSRHQTNSLPPILRPDTQEYRLRGGRRECLSG